jgi:hypothetical protein
MPEATASPEATPESTKKFLLGEEKFNTREERDAAADADRVAGRPWRPKGSVDERAVDNNLTKDFADAQERQRHGDRSADTNRIIGAGKFVAPKETPSTGLSLGEIAAQEKERKLKEKAQAEALAGQTREKK